MRISVAGDTLSRSRRSAAGKTPRFSPLTASLSMKRLYTRIHIYIIIYYKQVRTIYAIICEMICETIRRYIKVDCRAGPELSSREPTEEGHLQPEEGAGSESLHLVVPVSASSARSALWPRLPG